MRSSSGPVSAAPAWAVNRIMIVGQPGSGKSTLAQTLGERTGLPVIHIDKIHWQPGWIERSRAEKTLLCKEAEKGERWIFEGGHSVTWPSRVSRADVLIWVDRPVGLRLWRVLRRAILGLGRTRPDMAEGCPERLRSLPEFFHYIWQTRNSGSEKIARLSELAPPGCKVFRLRTDREVEDFITAFAAS
jgi:adenylate kinase family enzyme